VGASLVVAALQAKGVPFILGEIARQHLTSLLDQVRDQKRPNLDLTVCAGCQKPAPVGTEFRANDSCVVFQDADLASLGIEEFQGFRPLSLLRATSRRG